MTTLFANKLSTKNQQLLLLLGMLFVRFGYPLFDQPAFAILTYILAFLYIRTIPKADRSLFHLTWPGKKVVLVVILVALFCIALVVAEWLLLGCELIGEVSHPGKLPLLAWILVTRTTIQFVMNALPEEFLFRGFLWEFMSRRGMSGLSILFIQAILFWAGHYFHWHIPWNWISTLLQALVIGLVAWKTKSVYMSGIVHAAWNASSMFFVASPESLY